MKKLNFEILPKRGLGQVEFGSPMETLAEYLGHPEDLEELEDSDDFTTVVMHYWDEKITVFIEGIQKQVISCFEAENPDCTLYGKWVFNLNEQEIKDLMKGQGFSMLDEDMEEWGEKRVSFEDAMIDFFFSKDGKLLSVSWGVLVNDKGEIEEV